MRLKSFFTNSLGILVSRITGLGRDVLMANALGASIWSDMFFVAFKLPNLFRRIFAEGAFTQALLPSFISSRHKGVFAVTIFVRFFLFLFAFSLIVTLFPQPFTKLLAWGWDRETIEATAVLTAINFWYLDLIFIVTFLATLLQYKEHFATTAFSTALLNLSMITALLLTLKSDAQTVAYALSFAVIVGGVLQVTAHLVALRKKRLDRLLFGGIKYRKDKEVSAEVKRFRALFLPGILGNATPQIAAFVDTILATFLSAGAVSYLFYANRVFQLPLALIAIAASVALFPSISKALRHGKNQEALTATAKAFWILLPLLALATLGGMIFAEAIVWLLFERGKFDAQDTRVTSEVLRMYMIGLIPYGLAKLFSLHLYANKQHKKAAMISLYALLSSLIASLVLMQTMQAAGLALAGSLGGIILLTFTLKALDLPLKPIILRPKALLAVALLLILCAYLFNTLNGYVMQAVRA